MSHKLQNYLRAHRKRSGLSQQEIAFLLGSRSGSKVSRYEQFARLPSPRTVFAYEMIFRLPARDLFAGIYAQVGSLVFKRARVLGRRLAPQIQEKPSTLRKVAALRAIVSRVVDKKKPDHA